jgi:hypothetical protein
MRDTDWRPTPCPHCGVMREAKQYPVCENKHCNYFALVGDVAVKQMERTMKKEQKYVWIAMNCKPPVIINDLAALFKHPDFDADNDQIFELGPEVKIKMQIVTIPAHPVKREPSWENKE